MVHSMPSVLLLPSELKHCIIDLSPNSSLASLARTHTVFRREAEWALYRNVVFLSCAAKSLRCLETLATNPEKASFVRSLTMECEDPEGHLRRKDSQKKFLESDRTMKYLLKGLINMHSLFDLRLKMCENKLKWISKLKTILCGGHFQLQTLYCNEELLVDDSESEVIKSQNELQLLGLYRSTYPDNLLKTIKHIQDAQLPLPIIVGFRWESDPSSNFENVMIFPAFYSVDCNPTFHQILAKSDKNSPMRVNVDDVYDLSIYVVDLSSIPFVHALAENLAVTFPMIESFTISFERECEIPSREIKEILALFSNLDRVSFALWPTDERSYTSADQNVSTDVQRAQAKELGAACPKLYTVTFMDCERFARQIIMNGPLDRKIG